jgi:hypothetical protein
MKMKDYGEKNRNRKQFKMFLGPDYAAG